MIVPDKALDGVQGSELGFQAWKVLLNLSLHAPFGQQLVAV